MTVKIVFMEEEIQDFWQSHPCGAELVGDLSEKSKHDYEGFFNRYDDFRYRTESHILKNLDTIDFHGKRVLEIGLGQGADAEQIIKRDGIYSGLDLTEESVTRVKMRFSLRNLPFEEVKQGSAVELPFADNSFDIIYSHGVLHHIPDIAVAQKEIARVLKSDGKLIVMLYAKRSLNYMFSISLMRRLGLVWLYFFNPKVGGIYQNHLENAREKGIWNYLKMRNFIHVNTDGAFNPYSKIYDVAEVKKDFSEFSITESHQEFMHAPPLKIKWLPVATWLGWHLWVKMKKK
jgi:ubiquinone/menaquinone biosynthesis C-methylase UbiE